MSGAQYNFDTDSYGYSITKFDAELSIGGGIKIGRFKVIYATRSGSQEIGEPKILSINYRML